MVFNYYYNLTSKQQFIYRKSDRIEAVDLHWSVDNTMYIKELKDALAREDRKKILSSTRRIINFLTGKIDVPPVNVKVLAVRPSSRYGELYGLYEPAQMNNKAVITVWMRTVKHRRVVAFKTYLRTVLHEFCHHLDYEYYKLADSFHTGGFFKRESSLLKQLLPDEG